MCFSPEASLSAGLVLLPAEACALSLAERIDRRYLPLAAIPLIFGIQQLCEAVAWVGIRRGNHF
ncbi:DUF6629 family protein [Zavarzinella formosa]|uniref:DUF6629 family protein n=1 Tax=Zavarzinella formosa TaxID=360055 RepID=UPI00030C99FC|nr:DUF6629 family protein [Zavarzinella formosa]